MGRGWRWQWSGGGHVGCGGGGGKEVIVFGDNLAGEKVLRREKVRLLRTEEVELFWAEVNEIARSRSPG